MIRTYLVAGGPVHAAPQATAHASSLAPLVAVAAALLVMLLLGTFLAARR